jgi:hypothetical protein
MTVSGSEVDSQKGPKWEEIQGERDMPAKTSNLMCYVQSTRHLVLAVVVTLICLNGSIANAQSKPTTRVLQGNVEIQDATILPLYSTDLPSIDQESVDKLSADNQWFRIPHWLSGRWRVEEQTEYYRLDYQTKVETIQSKRVSYRFEEKWGTQFDRSGDVWHFSEQPNSNAVDLGEQTEIRSTLNCEAVTSSGASVSLRLQSIVQRYDKKTQSVLETTKIRTVQTYKPLTKNVFRVESIAYTYTMDGTPLSVSKRFWLASRIESFEPVYVCNARSVLPLFCEYLAYNKLAPLIPQ